MKTKYVKDLKAKLSSPTCNRCGGPEHPVRDCSFKDISKEPIESDTLCRACGKTVKAGFVHNCPKRHSLYGIAMSTIIKRDI